MSEEERARAIAEAQEKVKRYEEPSRWGREHAYRLLVGRRRVDARPRSARGWPRRSRRG